MNDSADRSRGLLLSLWLFFVSMVAVPVSVLLHELGHYGAYCAFDFASPAIHYSSSGFSGDSEFWANLRSGNRENASEIAGITQMGIAALLGLIVSYLTVGLGIWSYIRFELIEGLCIAASSAARFPLVAVLFILGGEFHDEAQVQQALGIPEYILFAIGVSCTTAATLGAAYLLYRRKAVLQIFPICLGVVAGTFFWLNGVGAFLIP